MSMPMLDTYPDRINIDRVQLAGAIDALLACAATCTACADACLSEQMVGELTKCVRTNLDCADICDTTARVLSRHTGYDANISRAQLAAAAMVSGSCADECLRHQRMEHCRICAEVCRAAERASQDLLASMERHRANVHK
ncbi:MAG: four-helix bundle copper-binding protein [Micromonosporaceae bacterium]|nr:four-helix bundle copper-binding protein [Micromonosporaceae bacterium]